MAMTYLMLDDWVTAYDYASQACQLFDADEVHEDHARVILDLGIICSEAGRLEEAIGHFQKALKLYEQTSDDFGKARVLNSCYVDYARLGRIQEALYYGQKSAEVFAAIGDSFGQGIALSSVAEVYLAAHNHQEALNKLKKAQVLLQLLPQSLEALTSIYMMACSYAEQDDLERAQALFSEVLEQSQAHKTLSYKCHAKLAEIYEKRGNHQAALVEYKRYQELYAAYINEESEGKLRKLEVLHKINQARVDAERQRRLREEDRRQFEQLSQMQREFITMASHDIKNPLACIFGAVDLLESYRGEKADETELSFYEEIRLNSRRVLSLVADMLDLAKYETGYALVLKDVAIHAFLAGILEPYKRMAKNQMIKLETIITLVHSNHSFDPQALSRALENLLANAFKFTPSGGQICLEVKEDEWLSFTVSDSGSGIPEGDLPNLFKRFYRTSTPALSDGSGLGLAIVKAIVSQHGGSVEVSSRLNAGGSFNICIPARAIIN